jgi:hypothetical protein
LPFLLPIYKKTGPETRTLFEFQDRKTAVTGYCRELEAKRQEQFYATLVFKSSAQRTYFIQGASATE